MKKRVFRNKIVYWISIIYFFLVSFDLIISLINIKLFFENKLSYFLILIAAIFTITILVNLIEKFKNTTLLITIYFSIIIIFNVFFVLKFYLGGNSYLIELRDMFLNIIFLIVFNYFKINKKYFENFEEIDQIGNKNLEP